MKSMKRMWGGIGGACGAMAVVLGLAGAQAQRVELGDNVLVFSPTMPAQEIQRQIDKVYAAQQHSEFGSERYALAFLPGEYHVDVPIGFYTQVIGLGVTPDAVRIVGNVHADASLPNNNATCTFWRAVEGFSVIPTSGAMRWAVSQSVSFRRMHVRGDLVLHQNRGWASGGWIADSVIDGTTDSGTQQQWITRNSEWARWSGANWNMVFVGVPQAPKDVWPEPPYTTIDQTPIVREKPFIFVDAAGAWNVDVPELRRDSTGITWRSGQTPGRTLPLTSFYIAHAGRDTAATMNAQLARGKNLLLTPGIYDLDAPLDVTHPDAVVLGLGYATLHPVHGTAALATSDVDGIEIAGLLLDAGPETSPVLMRIGPQGSRANHARNPIALHDVFFRVGGAGVGRTQGNLEINSRNTIVDHTWIWRADHGAHVGWTENPSANGLVVNADDVTIYGLFVEHHQQFQVVWSGNRGRTYFYQSEIPYDPPTQPGYTSAPGVNGWASYKVADTVREHEAWGLGIYSVFLQPSVTLTRAIEVPRAPGVRFHHMITVALGDKGEISNVIDNTGGPTSITPRVTPRVTQFP